MLIVISILLLFFTAYPFEIISNYPLPKNNLKEIYKETKDINYITYLLEKTENFERITVKGEKIFLKRKPIAKKIYIYGNKSFWKREILAITGLIEGHVFDKNLLQQITQRLKKFYWDKGYPFANIKMDCFIDKKGDSIIKIYIDENKRRKIRKIYLVSDTQIPPELKKSILKEFLLKKGDYFSFFKLQKSIERVSSYLIEKGYFDNFETFYSLVPTEDGKIDIKIFVSLGFKYKIIFIGNKYFSEEELKKSIKFEEGINYYQIGKAVEKLIKFYKSHGFLDIKITPEYKEDYERNLVYLTFKIKEGKPYKISHIYIDTDVKDLDREFQKFVGRPYNREKLESILKDFFIRYYNDGYLAFSFYIKEKIDKAHKNVSLDIYAKKGKKFILKSIKIVDTGYKTDIKTPSVYKPEEILQVLEDIQDFFKNKGYLDVKVNLNSSFREEKDFIYVYIKIDVLKGKIYRRTIPFIYGTWHLYPEVIQKNLSHSKFFIKEEFDSELDYLYSTYLFDTINPYIDINKKEKKVRESFILHEDKRGLFQGSIGYNSNQKFKLALKGSLKNLFKYGFEIYGYLETSTLGNTYQFSLLNKFVPFRNTVSLSLFKDRQIHRFYNLEGKGYDISVKKKKDRFRTYSIGLSYRDNLLKDQNIFPEKSFLSYKAYYTYTDIHGIPRDNPVKGYNLRYGFFFDFGDFSIQKIVASYRYFYTWKFLTFAPKISGGYIYQKLEKIPPSERFFLGGISNFRGFAYEEVAGKNKKGGQSFILLNNDIRFPLYRPFNLFGFIFLDTGNVYESFSDMKNLYLRNTTGGGVYIPTPAGAFTLYFAYNLNRQEGENLYRIEFSIATEF